MKLAAVPAAELAAGKSSTESADNRRSRGVHEAGLTMALAAGPAAELAAGENSAENADNRRSHGVHEAEARTNADS